MRDHSSGLILYEKPAPPPGSSCMRQDWHIARADCCAPIRVMGEILALRSGTFLPPCRVRTAAWIFAWCLLVHGTAGPGYPQTDSTPQRGSHGNTRSEERRVGKECRSRWS